MEIDKPVNQRARLTASWPNMFIFPRELREMIPGYGARALVVDEVDGSPDRRSFAAFGPPARLDRRGKSSNPLREPPLDDLEVVRNEPLQARRTLIVEGAS